MVQRQQPEQRSRPRLDPDDYEAGSYITAITRRYHGTPMPDGVMIRKGRDQIYLHNGPPPTMQRAGRYRTTTDDDLPDTTVRARRGGRMHWLFSAGLVFLVMLGGYVVFNAVGSWWQVHTNDSTYGRPRTFQTDAVVGHGDSQANPSHFVAVNLNRHIIIFEIPGGDIAKPVIYGGGTLLGDGQDLTPVTLSFSDVNGGGKPDMLVHINDQLMTFLNNGTKFVPPSSTVNGGNIPPILGG